MAGVAVAHAVVQHVQFIEVAAAEAQVRLDRVTRRAADRAAKLVQPVELRALGLADLRLLAALMRQQDLLGA